MSDAQRIQQFAMTLDNTAGPVCYPVPVDFRAKQSADLDLSQLTENGHVGFLSGVFLDNTENAIPIKITVIATGQTVTFPANSYGFMPLLSPNPQRFLIQSVGGNVGAFIRPIFANTPINPFMVRV